MTKPTKPAPQQPTIDELREWAARVCGKRFWPSKPGYAIVDLGWPPMMDRDEWQPDTNDAQALEVLDAVAAGRSWQLEYDRQINWADDSRGGYTCWIGARNRVYHKDRRMVLLLACYAAADTKTTKGPTQ